MQCLCKQIQKLIRTMLCTRITWDIIFEFSELCHFLCQFCLDFFDTLLVRSTSKKNFFFILVFVFCCVENLNPTCSSKNVSQDSRIFLQETAHDLFPSTSASDLYFDPNHIPPSHEHSFYAEYLLEKYNLKSSDFG